MRLHPSFALCVALLGPLAAQEADAPPRAPAPILKIESSHLTPVLFMLARGLGIEAPPRELEKGRHYELTLDADRAAKLATVSGETAFLAVEADPPALMRAFAEEIERARAMAQGMMTLAMAQQGFDAETVGRLVTAMFDFPRELERATLIVHGDPSQPRPDGFGFELGLTVLPGGFGAQLLTTLRPSPQGAPLLPATTGALMHMAMSIDPKIMPALCSPCLDFLLAFSFPKPESRKAALAVWDKMIEMCDGTLVMSIGKTMAIEALYGYRDAEALARLVGSDEYLAMVRAQQPTRDIEIEVTPAAFEHHGSRFMKLVMINDGRPNPMMPNDEMQCFYGAVGSYLVMSGSEDGARQLADAIAEQKIVRAPLRDGALLTADVDFKGMLKAMGSTLPVGDTSKAPDRVAMTITVHQRTVTLDVRVE